MNTLIDPYPTRDARHWAITERKDPVVHGKNQGPLDQSKLDFFQSHGYLLLNGLVDHVLEEIIAEGDRLKDTADPLDERTILEPETQAVRSIFEVHRQSLRYQTLSQSNLADIARQILGSDVYIHQSRINYKPGFEGKPFYWHSDFETWHAEDGMPRMRAVSCVINLTENTHENGPLMIIPGSHQHFVQCQGLTPEDHYKTSLRNQEYGVPPQPALTKLVESCGRIDSMTGPPGSVIFFDCNAMHGSAGNITPMPRTNLFMVFNSVENTLADPFCGQKPRPEFIAARDNTPLSPN